ncbi:helix-turn-helix transcriptional regulator [Jidongwangia harbinensis]|uniref:helix-turn-helix transcriptional regulator n=1 Tax=Jidongwangia harbinensis TaxID=2878561 RepID=UPI001CDA38DC|nr:helix-turn-helix transcriptional regulator [Jidongwangia harbinensis]MCA2219248.1 helix-turn-helix transcriptional regulator [Jidongwangia harbinensis]
MDVKGHLDLLLLAVLADAGPVHGYAVITALRERSEGVFDVPEGTVYPALHRLERAGLVISRWEQATPRRRRVYELTTDGRHARTAKQSEWRRFVTGVQAVIGPAATRATA